MAARVDRRRFHSLTAKVRMILEDFLNPVASGQPSEKAQQTSVGL